MKSCLKRTSKALSIFKAVISRTLFILHGLICIWRVTIIKRNPVYWSLSGTIPVLFIETLYTLCRKSGGEWKWICPSVVLYLATSVPAIWFLELDLMQQRLIASQSRQAIVYNATNHVMVLDGKMINISISLGSEEWCKVLEQMLLLILIVGRWLLPKGEITREQLSQLLLVYIGMAADIIELFEAFKEKTVRENRTLTLIILALWTASLSQFTFVVTAAKSKKTRPSLSRSASTSSTCGCCGSEGCCPTEAVGVFQVISIMISVSLQDLPFLVLRMLLIFRYDVLSYTNIFFTCKNTLVLTLQIYRLVVLFTEIPSKNSNTLSHSATNPSLSSNALSYPSESGSEITESFSSASVSSDRRRRRLTRRRRSYLTRQVTVESGRTVTSSMDGGETTHSFETDHCRPKPSSNRLRRKSLVASPALVRTAKAESDSSSAKSPKHKKGAVKDKENLRSSTERKERKEKDTSKGKEEGGKGGGVNESKRNKTKSGNRRVEDRGEVERKVRKFEKQRVSHATSESNSSDEEDNQAEPTKPTNTFKAMTANTTEQSPSLSRKTRAQGKSAKGTSRGDAPSPSPKPERSKRHPSPPSPPPPPPPPPPPSQQQQTKAEFIDEEKGSNHSHNRHSRSKKANPASAEPWQSAKDLRTALAMLADSGAVRKVILKSREDGRTYFVVEPEEGST